MNSQLPLQQTPVYHYTQSNSSKPVSKVAISHRALISILRKGTGLRFIGFFDKVWGCSRPKSAQQQFTSHKTAQPCDDQTSCKHIPILLLIRTIHTTS